MRASDGVWELFASDKIECVAISEPVRYCVQNPSVQRRIIMITS